jgi:hypothetical protein
MIWKRSLPCRPSVIYCFGFFSHPAIASCKIHFDAYSAQDPAASSRGFHSTRDIFKPSSMMRRMSSERESMRIERSALSVIGILGFSLGMGNIYRMEGLFSIENSLASDISCRMEIEAPGGDHAGGPEHRHAQRGDSFPQSGKRRFQEWLHRCRKNKERGDPEDTDE